MTRRRAGIVSLDFAEIHDAVRAGQVDFILTNPALYAELEKLHGIRRITTLINQNVPGQPAMLMGGVILTRANQTDIDRLAALRGRSFMAVDPLSFGGWHMAWRELRKYGIEPERDFSSLQYGATHDVVVHAVLRGDVDAGNVRADTLERMAAAGAIRLEQIKVLNHREAPGFPFLLSTELYPEWPMAAVAHTPEKLSRLVALGGRSPNALTKQDVPELGGNHSSSS